MRLFGPRDSPPLHRGCRLEFAELKGSTYGAPILLCFNAVHRQQIARKRDSGLILASCPLQLLRCLDQQPRRLVLLDRCPAGLNCCRRPLGALVRRIQQEIRVAHQRAGRIKEAGLLRFTNRALFPANRLEAACRYFGQRPLRGMILGELAAFFGMSPRRLNRLFHRAGCDSPVRELRRQRLFGSLKEIQASSRSIDAIADDLHYSDRSSFVRAFRRAFGFYPSRFRKQPSDRE